MFRHGNPSDAELIAALDAERTDSWHTLLRLDEDFRQRPHADDDCVWLPQYPEYGARVDEACRVLVEINAVSPKYPWARLEPLTFDTEAKLTPADAIRLATAIVRGERFCYGNIEQALNEGMLQAVVAALADWYRDRLG
jgi:hypothetical protein